jgi:hypothetical protein
LLFSSFPLSSLLPQLPPSHLILKIFPLIFRRYLVFKAEVTEMREAAMAAAGMTNQPDQPLHIPTINTQITPHPNNYSNKHEEPKEKERMNLDPLAPALAAFAKIREKTKKVVKDPADKPRKMCLKLLRDRLALPLPLSPSSLSLDIFPLLFALYLEYFRSSALPPSPPFSPLPLPPFPPLPLPTLPLPILPLIPYSDKVTRCSARF